MSQPDLVETEPPKNEKPEVLDDLIKLTAVEDLLRFIRQRSGGTHALDLFCRHLIGDLQSTPPQLAEKLNLRRGQISKLVLVGDFSGSQQLSSLALIDFYGEVAENYPGTVVVPFGAYEQSLVYDVYGNPVKVKNATYRNRQHLVAGNPPTPIDSLHALLLQYTRSAERIFSSSTSVSGIKTGLQCLKNSGELEDWYFLVIQGDGEFDGGVPELLAALNVLQHVGVFEKCVKVIFVPSPHTSAITLARMQEQMTEFCNAAAGATYQQSELRASGMGTHLKDLLPTVTIRSDSSYRLLEDMYFHSTLLQLTRAQLADVIYHGGAVDAVTEMLMKIVSSGAQLLTKLQRDPFFSRMYAALITVSRMDDVPECLVMRIRELLVVISDLVPKLTGEQKAIVEKLLSDAKKDDALVRKLTKVLEAQPAQYYLAINSVARRPEMKVLANICVDVPDVSTIDEILHWVSTGLELHNEQPEQPEEKAAYHFVIPVPSLETPQLLVRCFQLLPSLLEEGMAWNVRTIFVIAALVVTRLTPRETTGSESGIEKVLYNMFRNALSSKCFLQSLSVKSEDALNVEGKLSGFFCDLVVHAQLASGGELCPSSLFRFYNFVRKLHRIRRLCSESLSIQRVYQVPRQGTYEIRSDMLREDPSIELGNCGVNYAMREVKAMSSLGISLASVYPFLIGVYMNPDGDWAYADVQYRVDWSNVRAMVKDGRPQNAYRYILEMQIRELVRGAFYDEVAAWVLSVYKGNEVPTFSNWKEAQACVQRFRGLVGEVRMEDVEVQHPISISVLLRHPRMCDEIRLPEAAGRMLAGGSGRVNLDIIRSAIKLWRNARPHEPCLRPSVEVEVNYRVRFNIVPAVVLTEEEIRALAYELLQKLQACQQVVMLAKDIPAFEMCSVCFTSYTKGSAMLVVTECGHFYCLSCLDEWTKIVPGRAVVENSQNCPLCRQPLSERILNRFMERLSKGGHDQEIPRGVYNGGVLNSARELDLDNFIIMMCQHPGCRALFPAAERTCGVQEGALARLCDNHNFVTNNTKVKRCPGCSAPTERTYGCYHMTCIARKEDGSICNTHWCWNCCSCSFLDDAGEEIVFDAENIYDHSCFQLADADEWEWEY